MRRKISLLLWLLFITVPLFSQTTPKGEDLSGDKVISEEIVEQEIIWSAVPNASYYRCVVKLGDRVFFEKKTEENQCRLSLPPGEYTYIIYVYNNFSQLSAQTPEKKLTVLRKERPVLSLMEKRLIRYMQKGGISFEFGGIDIREEGKIYLIDSSGNEIEGTFSSIGGNLFRAQFSDESITHPDLYSLKVVNPSGRWDILNNFIDIRIPEKPLEPVLKSVSVSRYLKRLPYFAVTARGSGFEKGVKVFFRHNSSSAVYEATGVKITSRGNLRFNIDFSHAVLGIYDVEVVNPTGKRMILKKVTTVTQSGNIDTVGEDATMGEKLVYWAQKDEGVFIGYSPTLFFLSNNSELDAIGGSLVGFDFVFRNGFIKNPKVVAFGFEAWFKYAYYAGYYNQTENLPSEFPSYVADVRYHNFMMDLCLFWKFSIPVVSINLRLGTGWTFGNLEDNHDSMFDGFFPNLLCGAGLSTVVASRLSFEAGVNLRLLPAELVFFEPYLLIGYLWE